MRRTRASAPWMRFALASGLALAAAVVSGAAQRPTILTNGRNLQIPINHGLPDQQLGFTFCRLRYQNIRRARKSGWGDDYPQADNNFMVRLSELTTTTISRWNNGDPGFANVTAMDPELFRCPYLRMQNAANYDFTPEETVRMHDYLLKGGFLWIDDNWDPDFDYIRPNLVRILPGAKIVDLPVDHPMFSIVYRINPLPQIPSLGSWMRTHQTWRSGLQPCTGGSRKDMKIMAWAEWPLVAGPASSRAVAIVTLAVTLAGESASSREKVADCGQNLRNRDRRDFQRLVRTAETRNEVGNWELSDSFQNVRSIQGT